METTKHKDNLNTIAADQLAFCSTRASAAMKQYTQDMSINQVYILIKIL